MLQNNNQVWEKDISLTPSLFDGMPYIKGTDVPVYKVLLFLSKKISLTALKREYPQLKDKDIYSALACAAHAFQWEAKNGDGVCTGE